MKDCTQTTPEARWVTGLAFLTLLTTAVALVAGIAAGVPLGDFYRGYFRAAGELVLPAMFLFGLPISVRALIRKVKNPLEELHAYLVGRLGSLDQAIGTVMPVVLTILLLAAFGILKQLQPLVAPFSWDDAFAETGRFLLFGHQGWQITHALFPTPRDTQIINFIYFLWLPIMFFSVLGFAALAPRHIRARFFLTFGVSWVLLGVVASFLLSSAGPCYANLIGASSAKNFVPLMERLRTMDTTGYPIGSLHWQAELWQDHIRHQYGLGLGISAMPSMHNSIAFLYVLAAGRGRVVVRCATWLFAIAILVASVHLGWHYLADGLFGWAAMAAIWWAAGVYLRWCGYAIEATQPNENFAPPGSIKHIHDPVST